MSETQSSKKPVNLPPAKNFPYSPNPMVNHFPGNAEDCFDLVNQYGTYEIQRTADTGNFFPAIAQGRFSVSILLPRLPDFRAVSHGRLLAVADDGRF